MSGGEPTGIVLFAHGSRLESANEAVRTAAAELVRQGGFGRVESAFLELAEPDLPGAVARLTAEGIRRILIIPYFLTPGRHVERDLPRLIDGILNANKDLDILVTPSLDGQAGLIQVLVDLARGAGLERQV